MKLDLIRQAETYEEIAGRTAIFSEVDHFHFSEVDHFHNGLDTFIYYDPLHRKMASTADEEEMCRLSGSYFWIDKPSNVIGPDIRLLWMFPVWNEERRCIDFTVAFVSQQTWQMTKLGTVSYNLAHGFFDFRGVNGTQFWFGTERRENGWRVGQVVQSPLVGGKKDFAQYAIYNISGGTPLSIEDICRQNYHFRNGTGLVLQHDYNGFVWRLGKLSELNEKPAIERATYRDNFREDRAWLNDPVLIRSDDKSELKVDGFELSDETVKEIKRALREELFKQDIPRRYYDDLPYNQAYAMAICPTPKRARTMRSVGVIYCGLRTQTAEEYFPFAYAKVSSTGDIRDIYIRCKWPNSDDCSYLRPNGQYFKHINTLVGKPLIIAGTLKEATNLHNQRLLDAIGVSCGGVTSLQDIKMGTNVKVASVFCEQLLRLKQPALAELARSLIGLFGDRSNWQIYHSLSDLIPGADDKATSVYKALGLSKAWTKWVFSQIGKNGETTFYEGLVHLVNGVRLVIATGQSDQAPSKDGMAGVIDYVKFVVDSALTQAFRQVYSNDPKRELSTIRTYNRMINKISAATNNSSQCLQYYRELAWKYFEIQTIKMVPEQFNLFLEFGLPETGFEDILDMMKRRSVQAEDVYAVYKSKIDAEKRAKVEAEFKKHKSWYAGLATKRDETIDGFRFFTPSQIYDVEDNRSIEHEGHEMHHCVFNNYANRIADGQYMIMYMRHDVDHVFMTIGIKPDGTVDQTFLMYDGSPKAADLLPVKHWIDKHSDRLHLPENGQPSGCNYDMREMK